MIRITIEVWIVIMIGITIEVWIVIMIGITIEVWIVIMIIIVNITITIYGPNRTPLNPICIINDKNKTHLDFPFLSNNRCPAVEIFVRYRANGS